MPLMVLVKGFRFGMLLQLAVGPVALFIFQTALVSGFRSAVTGVIGVALVDALFIAAAVAGIGTFLHKDKAALVMNTCGAIILAAFGISTVLGVFGLGFIPGLNLAQGVKAGSVFQRALLITASNPLTILFWAGVFSARLAQGDVKGSETYTFGSGAVLATLFFLTLIALMGMTTGQFLPDTMIRVMNAAVGLLLIYYGVKLFRAKG